MANRLPAKISSAKFSSNPGKLILKIMPYLVLVLTPVFASIVYQNTKHDVYTSVADNFNNQINSLKGDIGKRTDFYLEGFRGIQGLFEASADVSRLEFKTFLNKTSLLNRYKGISSINFLERVTDKQAFAKELMSDPDLIDLGATDLKIFPDLDKPEYYAIKYIEPLSTSLNLVGFDAASDPVRFEFISKAIDNASPVVTQVVRSPSSTRPAFLIYLPIYENGTDISTKELRRKNINGLIAGLFTTEDFFKYMLEDSGVSKSMSIKIHDASSIDQINADNLMYQNNLEFAAEPLNLNRKLIYDVGDTKWILDLSYIPDPASSRLLDTPAIRMVAIGFIGVLVFLLTYIISRRGIAVRETAEALARRSLLLERTFLKISENDEQLFFVLDENLNFILLSEKLAGLLEIPSAKLWGCRISENSVPEILRSLTEKVEMVKGSKNEFTDKFLKFNGSEQGIYSYRIIPILEGERLIGVACSIKEERIKGKSAVF